MTRDEREEMRKILRAHARTVDLCEACAVTARDLAAEVARGGTPPRQDLERTMIAAEGVLEDLVAVRQEIDRIAAELE